MDKDKDKDKKLQQICDLIGEGKTKQGSMFNIYNNQSITINFISNDDEAEQLLKGQLVEAETS